MSRSGIILFCLLLIGCKTAPVKQIRVIPHSEYKNYVKLKETPAHKTLPEKIKEVFKKKPKVVNTNKVELVKLPPPHRHAKEPTKVVIPKRRIRTNETQFIINTQPELLPMSPRPVEQKPQSNFFLYFTYFQALIIIILSVYIYIKVIRKLNAAKSTSKKPGELNL